ncbi:LysE family transporter [bacterium]|nr:LysE family transporter [bacterium]
MYEFSFVVKSFFIGAASALAFGPIFILTFNRAALCGFKLGLATAAGAALADGFFFSLSLVGVLSAVSSPDGPWLHILSLFGGAGLLALGLYGFYGRVRDERVQHFECVYSFLIVFLKTVAITVFNPAGILFFVVICLRFFPGYVGHLSKWLAFQGGVAVAGGSMFSLSFVSYLASRLGAKLSHRMLALFSHAVAAFFCMFGLYLLFDFFRYIVYARFF